jgi:hypothetical protein
MNHDGFPAMYRRVSSKQVDRARQRAETYTNLRRSTTPTEDTHLPNMDSKKRKIANNSPEIARNNIEDIITANNIDTPITVKPEYEFPSPIFLPVIAPQTLYEHQPESMVQTEYEHAEITYPPKTFFAKETDVNPKEYAIAISAPEPTICDSLDTRILKPNTIVVDKPQVKFDPHTKNPEPRQSNTIALQKVILCPCCNIQMTPNHECLNKSLSEYDSPNIPTTSPPSPCPVEPTTHPPDTNVGRGGLMNDPDFDRRMRDFCDATISSPDCKTQ